MPVATIKFYLREQLLPPGRSTGRNQAIYGEEHLRRLQLIRVFTTIGQLDLTSVRRLLTTIDDERLPLLGLYCTLNEVLARPADPTHSNPGLDEAMADVDRLVATEGWRVPSNAATRSHLATVLSALRRIDGDYALRLLDEYVKVTDQFVQREVDRLPLDRTDRATAVVHSLLLREAYAAIHRLAQEHHVRRRFGTAPTEPRSN